MLRRLVLAVIILALLCGAGCFSGIGPEEIVSSVLSDGSGNILVAYRVQRNSNDHDIHLQKIGSNGSVLWDISLPARDERRASVIGMADGENGSVYVAWEVLGPEGRRRSERVTLLALVDADGQISFQEEFAERGIQLIAVDAGSVTLHQTNNEVSRSIHLKVDAGCVILNQTNDEEFHAIRFDSDGNRLWSQKIPGETGLRLAAGFSGETLMLWGNRDNPYFVVQKLAVGQLLWAQEDAPEGVRIKYLKTALWPEPQIISDGSGGAIISWAEMTGLEMPSYIWVCRIGKGGDVLWSTPVRELPSTINVYTRIVGDRSGGAIVVWEDSRHKMSLYAQKVNPEGEIQWHDNGVPICSDIPEVSPRFEAVSSGEGGMVVAWIDGDRNLYAQMLDASGKRLWGDKGILIAKGACHLPVKLCVDGQSGFIIGWSTGWDTYQPNDSYLQQLDSNGNLLWGKKGVRLSP